MAGEQRTSAEQRAALRARYTPEPALALGCPDCGRPMVNTTIYADEAMLRWRCPHCSAVRHRPTTDDSVIAAVDDADALAGALAERDDAMEAQENAWRNVNLLTRRLSEERVALHEEVARLRAALASIEARVNRWYWDDLDASALEAIDDVERIARAALATQSVPAPESAPDAPRIAQDAPHGANSPKASSARIAGAAGAPGAKTEGGR